MSQWFARTFDAAPSVDDQPSDMTDYQVQRHPYYQAMRDRLRGEIDELRAEVSNLRVGIMHKWKPAEVRALPLVQELRERHHALKGENENLRKQLREALPTRYSIQKSEPFRKLRAERDGFRDEMRAAQKEVRRLRWAEEGREAHRDRAVWAMGTLRQVLPPQAMFDPPVMVDWHLEQAALWADIAKLPLSALTSRLRYMREDGFDPHRHHREGGYVPAGLRMKLLHEDAECARCTKSDSPKNPLTIDHIIPLLHGGTSDEKNLQVLCRSCNSKKGARLEAASAEEDVA